MDYVWIDALRCWVGKYEVTNGEYRAFKPEHDSKEAWVHSLNAERQPVVHVSFQDACEFAQWLTEREQRAGRPAEGREYRLPTGDEWITFAQCGDGRVYPWGNEWPPKYGNYADETAKQVLGFGRTIAGYDDGFPVACPVEKSGENDWGLFGVGGNAWEWTAKTPNGPFDALRGASWGSCAQVDLRCDGRVFDPSVRYGYVGFRLLLSR